MGSSCDFDVAAVIPIHNGRDLTLRCLDSLQKGTKRPSQTIVVDDGSVDGSAQAIRACFPAVTVLPGDGNMWWSGAMNAGARHAFGEGATHIYSINNDSIVGSGSIEATCGRLFGGEPGLVCSKVRAWPEDGRLVSAGGNVNWWWNGLTLRGSGALDVGQFDVEVAVDWMPGMGVLVPRACYEAVGGYDERGFPHYMGDADFSLRVHLAGFTLHYEPRSVIWNDTSQTGLQMPHRPTLRDVRTLLTDRRSQFNLRENIPFFYRHAPRPALVAGLGSRYALILAHLARRRLRNRST